jgi:hypothetical protein
LLNAPEVFPKIAKDTKYIFEEHRQILAGLNSFLYPDILEAIDKPQAGIFNTSSKIMATHRLLKKFCVIL